METQNGSAPGAVLAGHLGRTLLHESWVSSLSCNFLIQKKSSIPSEGAYLHVLRDFNREIEDLRDQGIGEAQVC